MFSIERLKYQLYKHQMKQRDLANAIGVSEVTISRYIHSNRAPRSEIVARMAVALDTTIDYLMGGADLEDVAYADEAFKQTVRFIRMFRGRWGKAKKVEIISELIEEEIEA